MGDEEPEVRSDQETAKSQAEEAVRKMSEAAAGLWRSLGDRQFLNASVPHVLSPDGYKRLERQAQQKAGMTLPLILQLPYGPYAKGTMKGLMQRDTVFIDIHLSEEQLNAFKDIIKKYEAAKRGGK